MDEDQETQPCPDHRDEDNAGEDKPVDITKGRLYIKLKFPTVANRSSGEEAGMHGNEQLETLQTRKDYVCDFCNKRFSSGKGLGGHKRVHTQANKRHHKFLQRKIHKPKFKKNVGVEDRCRSKAEKDDFDATCVMCGKTFPSMKSLFGHMRSHPEREWRGIYPPARPNCSLSVPTVESASTCGVHDRATVNPDDTGRILSPADDALQHSRSEWRVTGKRRFNSSDGDVSGSPSGPIWSDWVSTELELEASDNLLLLAKGNHALNDKKVKRESSQVDRACTTAEKGSKAKGKMEKFQGFVDDNEDDEDGNNNKEVDIKGYSHKRSNEVELNCENGEYKVTQYRFELNILVEKGYEKGNIQKKKRKRSFRNLEAGADDIDWSHSRKISKTPEKFRCNICYKSFSSHQALGGHMSSHSKFTIKNGDNHEVLASADEEVDESTAIVATTQETKKDSGDYHEVSASVYQEANESDAIAAATQQTEKDGSADAECCEDGGNVWLSVQASSPKMLVIDLNKLPPMEEDDQEG